MDRVGQLKNPFPRYPIIYGTHAPGTNRNRGEPLTTASNVLLILHRRGDTAQDIPSLAQHLNVVNFALLAPQATGLSWYSQSFLAPPAQNEPALSSALSMLTDLLGDLESQGINRKNLYLLGFSQGACLALEFAARNADRYGVLWPSRVG